ncbi:hypothetical protein THAOC_27743 [Thalassiosira oceanica]|uniref:Uncharacterized protein n=1 Tax=Thalassiosira oceanica TaxID=159749 RepID=K0RI52_THAOC|nr:hypothetical protein THAOC_27743 [Thalassiosira oceanica]|eukprot:EJK52925.1 hypothetical protein THAOC_27743 [Thalassiosira oceanica]
MGEVLLRTVRASAGVTTYPDVTSPQIPAVYADVFGSFVRRKLVGSHSGRDHVVAAPIRAHYQRHRARNGPGSSCLLYHIEPSELSTAHTDAEGVHLSDVRWAAAVLGLWRLLQMHSDPPYAVALGRIPSRKSNGLS